MAHLVTFLVLGSYYITMKPKKYVSSFQGLLNSLAIPDQIEAERFGDNRHFLLMSALALRVDLTTNAPPKCQAWTGSQSLQT